MLAPLVPPAAVGGVFSFLGMLDAASWAIADVLFTSIFAATAAHFPSAAGWTAAGSRLLALLASMWLVTWKHRYRPHGSHAAATRSE